MVKEPRMTDPAENYYCDGPAAEEWEDADGNEITTDYCTQDPEWFYGSRRCDICPRLGPQ